MKVEKCCVTVKAETPEPRSYTLADLKAGLGPEGVYRVGGGPARAIVLKTNLGGSIQEYVVLWYGHDRRLEPRIEPWGPTKYTHLPDAKICFEIKE